MLFNSRPPVWKHVVNLASCDEFVVIWSANKTLLLGKEIKNVLHPNMMHSGKVAVIVHSGLGLDIKQPSSN